MYTGDDGHSEWWDLRCKKWSCPSCRLRQTAELVDRVAIAFDGRPGHRADFGKADWKGVYQKLNRRGIDYVNLPGPAETVTILTYEALPESGPAGDAREMAEEAIRARPLAKGIRWSAGGSPEWKASFAKPKAAPTEEKLTLVGTWDHRVTVAQVAEKAVEVGLAPEHLEGDDDARIAGLRFDVPWDDPRYVDLRRWVGFTWPDHSAADPPLDVFEGESWDAMATYLTGSAG